MFKIYPYQLQNLYVPNEADWHKHKIVSQGSDEWHALREKSIGSSEAAAVFPSGISKTVEPYQLKKKLLGSPPVVTAYMQMLFDRGSEMEPVLRKELMELTGCAIIETGVFTHIINGVKFNASLDGVLICSRTGENTLCVTEFKYRANATYSDCGWAKEPNGPRIHLGVTVWCQVQHQMWVSGIHAGLVYSGGVDGSRRLWYIKYCPTYIAFWLPYVERFFEEYVSQPEKSIRFPTGEKVRVLNKLNGFMAATSNEVYLS